MRSQNNVEKFGRKSWRRRHGRIGKEARRNTGMDVGRQSVQQTSGLFFLLSLTLHGAVQIPGLGRRSRSKTRPFGPVLLLVLLKRRLRTGHAQHRTRLDGRARIGSFRARRITFGWTTLSSIQSSHNELHVQS